MYDLYISSQQTFEGIIITHISLLDNKSEFWEF